MPDSRDGMRSRRHSVIGDGLKERALGVGGRFPLRLEAGEVGLVGLDMVAWQEDGAAGQ